MLQPYLPANTPGGIKDLRESDKASLQGNGEGQRVEADRIYDYDVYNDLGNPDAGVNRPTLGGELHPYPRRCRTGRPPLNSGRVLVCNSVYKWKRSILFTSSKKRVISKKFEFLQVDPTVESRVESPETIYVPRDEAFEEVKDATFSGGNLKAVLHNIIPTLTSVLKSGDGPFESFDDIDDLYKEGVNCGNKLGEEKGSWRLLISNILGTFLDVDEYFKFNLPQMIFRRHSITVFSFLISIRKLIFLICRG